MSLKVAFQMETMDQVDPKKNSSLVLMQGALKRGYEVYQYSPNEITLSPERVFARARKVNIDMANDPFYEISEDQLIDLTSVDAILMRQDPPFNMEYITATYMLEAIDKATFVVNNPVAVRNAPEKIFPFAFSKFMPKTIITEDLAAVVAFLHSEKDIIIKPLYMYGGTDVYRITLDNESDLEKQFQGLIDSYQAPVVAQKFIPEVTEGDKRILFINGEVVGAFLRVPQEGSVRANLMAGGELKVCELTDNDKAICEAIGPLLKERGFYICGIDIIGEYLTEINVTSPIGFREIDQLYDKDTASIFWDFVESKVSKSA